MFDKDIWGRPWATCELCTHPESEACCSRRHRAFCKNLARNPKAFGPIIAAEPACYDPPADRPHTAHTPAPPVAGPAPEPPLPGLASRAINYLGAVAAHVAAGRPVVDEATYQVRLAICRACAAYRASDARCSECGCYLMDDPARSPEPEGKARWADQACPIGRWLAYQVFDNPPRPGGCCGGGA